jgi:hypothetical protein
MCEKSEEELYEEAIRATCSLCVLEGRCVCGELDPLDEEDEMFFDENEEWGDDGFYLDEE